MSRNLLLSFACAAGTLVACAGRSPTPTTTSDGS